MLDNDYSKDLYAQYGGKFCDFEKSMKNTTNNTLLGIKFESPNPFINKPINNLFSYLWNFLNPTYASLLQATEKDSRYTISIDMKGILSVDITYLFLPFKTKQMIQIGRQAVIDSKLFK